MNKVEKVVQNLMRHKIPSAFPSLVFEELAEKKGKKVLVYKESYTVKINHPDGVGTDFEDYKTYLPCNRAKSITLTIELSEQGGQISAETNEFRFCQKVSPRQIGSFYIVKKIERVLTILKKILDERVYKSAAYEYRSYKRYLLCKHLAESFPEMNVDPQDIKQDFYISSSSIKLVVGNPFSTNNHIKLDISLDHFDLNNPIKDPLPSYQLECSFNLNKEEVREIIQAIKSTKAFISLVLEKGY